MKYSIIISVYNGEKYIDRCLKSILDQTYKNFEIIVVNDGSTDNSLNILKKYKQIRLYSTNENNGVSSARNLGISKAIGDYFIFVDIDDYVDNNMLKYIDSKITSDIDLVKYNYLITNSYENNVDDNDESEVLKGEEAFIKLVSKKIPFDLNCIYAYNTKFFKDNKFVFEVGKYHEDFGLIPYIIIKSNKVLILDKVLYFYIQSDDSITRTDNNDKISKKFDDILYHFDNLYKRINYDKNISIDTKKVFNSYIANAILLNYKKLNKQQKNKYKRQIKEKNIINLLLNDTIIRKIKKIIYKIML